MNQALVETLPNKQSKALFRDFSGNYFSSWIYCGIQDILSYYSKKNNLKCCNLFEFKSKFRNKR